MDPPRTNSSSVLAEILATPDSSSRDRAPRDGYTRRLLLPPRSLVAATVIVGTIGDDDVPPRRGRDMRLRREGGTYRCR